MRALPMLCLAFTMVAGPAFAGPPSPTEVHATTQQLGEVEGVYGLSNGKVLRLSVIDDRLYVDLNGGRRSVLVTVGENTYATHDGALQVTYKPDSNDEKIAVTIGVGTTASPQLPPLSDAQRLGRRTR